jgi:hypothetical protein
MRRAARVDSNHSIVLGAFIACGCEAESTAAMGKGFPDIVAEQKSTGRIFLVEVKDGSKPPSGRKLTEAQEGFHKRFTVHIIERVEDVPILLAGRPASLTQGDN